MNENVSGPGSRGDALGCWALLLALLAIPLMSLAILVGAGGLVIALAFLVGAAAVALVWFMERPGRRPLPPPADDFGDDRCVEVRKVEPLHEAGDPE